ncbi:methyltransferase domain-containing protein, partial [candidate division KSB1 bacterium]
ENNSEIRDGKIICTKCCQEYIIKNGVVNFLINPSKVVSDEIDGMENRFEKSNMDVKEIKNMAVNMPYYEGESKEEKIHYLAAKANFITMVEQLGISENDVLLDVAPGLCWTSNRFAKLGADVIALDIIATKNIGLETSDYYIEEGTYFERVQADMHKIPLKDETMDYIIFVNALHHSSSIDEVLKDCFNILKPGGKLVLIGEPSAGILTKKGEFGKEDIAEYHINENIYSYYHYDTVLKKCNFKDIQYFFPPSVDFRLSNGEHDWKRVNNTLFKFIHFFWKYKPLGSILKYLLFYPAKKLYNFQVHCIAEKK